MREPNDPLAQSQVDLAQLVQSHLSDRVPPLRREHLLSQIELIPGSTDAPLRAPFSWRALSRRTLLLALGSAASALGLAIYWAGPQGVYPEPIPKVGVPAAAQATFSPAASPPSGSQESLAAVSGPSGDCIRARGDDGLLADFEPNTGSTNALEIPKRDGRAGRWFHTRNTTGHAFEEQPLRIVNSTGPGATGGHALRIAGAPPVGWGANAGIRLERCYDASQYAGVSFKARGKGSLHVNLQTLDSVPADLGGRCTHKCWFTAGRYIVLTERFETHHIRWQDVSAPDPSYDFSREVMQLMFAVQSGPEPYEFWVDDVRFTQRTP
jgi:hypothetical protein